MEHVLADNMFLISMIAISCFAVSLLDKNERVRIVAIVLCIITVILIGIGLGVFK